MCTVIPGDCGCSGSSSSGVTAGGVLAFGGILAALAAGGWAFQQAWGLLLMSLAVGWVCAFPRARRAAFLACALVVAGLIGLARWIRKRRAKRTRALALRQPYQATVYVTGPDGRRAVLGTAPVPGMWTSPAEVQREVVSRWVATHGPHPAGQIGCHAQPVQIR